MNALKLKHTNEAIRLARVLASRAVFNGTIDEDVALLLILEHDEKLLAGVAEDLRILGVTIGNDLVLRDPEGPAAKMFQDQLAENLAGSGDLGDLVTDSEAGDKKAEPATLAALQEFARMGFDAPFPALRGLPTPEAGQGEVAK